MENRIIETMTRWGYSHDEIRWAIEHGAAKPNDKRSKALQGCARLGAAHLRPYEGVWVCGGGRYGRPSDQRESLQELLARTLEVV